VGHVASVRGVGGRQPVDDVELIDEAARAAATEPRQHGGSRGRTSPRRARGGRGGETDREKNEGAVRIGKAHAEQSIASGARESRAMRSSNPRRRYCPAGSARDNHGRDDSTGRAACSGPQVVYSQQDRGFSRERTVHTQGGRRHGPRGKPEKSHRDREAQRTVAAEVGKDEQALQPGLIFVAVAGLAGAIGGWQCTAASAA